MLTLALGIGANTAIYSLLDAVLLRPLPWPEPERLALIWETRPDGGTNSASGGAFLDWRANQTRFSAVVLTNTVAYNLRDDRGTERLSGMEVSHEFLQVLGVPARMGRGFLPEEDRPGGPTNVVMLTEEFWQSRFGGQSAILGRTLVLDDVPRTVVGILPREAWLFPEQSFFVPAVLDARDIARRPRRPLGGDLRTTGAAGHVRERERGTAWHQEAPRPATTPHTSRRGACSSSRSLTRSAP